jgi:CubicO group peptidase (beta-lactamase class C family)
MASIVPSRRLLVAMLAAAVVPAALAAQRRAEVPEDVRANVRARVETGNATGIVVGVVDGKGARYFSFGTTRPGGGDAVGPRTMYEIGSITKVFTSLALADMVVHGEAGLDDPLQRFLPAEVHVPERNGKPITLRLLAAQRSGLPRMPGNFSPRDPANPFADYDSTRLYSFLSGHTLTRDPGAQYEYSNVGVGLLGFALARHDHASYEAMVRRRVLGPLGMKNTMVLLSPEARKRLVPGYSDGRPVPNWDLDALAGAGALRSDAEDMTRFVAAAMGAVRTPLDSAFRLTEAPEFDAGSATMKIGLAWHILARPAMRIVWHNGGTGGYRTFAGFDPERRIGVVVLGNSTLSVDDVGFHLLDTTMAMVKPLAEVAIAPDSLDAYVGRYPLSPAFAITVTREGPMLWAQATGQERFRLYASGRNEFFLKVVQARMSFERDAQDKVVALVLHQNGADQRAARAP